MTDDDFQLVGDWPARNSSVTGLMIRDELGRYCLQLRDDFPHVGAAGKWGVFGGHVEAGETLLETAMRELEEETALVMPKDAFCPLIRFVTSDLFEHQYFFEVARPVKVSDIRVFEGAGFGFYTPAQIEGLDVIGSIPLVLHYLKNR